MWQQTAVNENKLQITLLEPSRCQTLSFSTKRHIGDYGMADGNKQEGGHEMLLRTIKYCEHQLSYCAPDQI